MTLEQEIQQSTFESPQHKALLNILFTASWLKLRGNQALKTHGITQEQYNVLRILRGQKGKAISLKDITGRMLDKSSNTSRIVDRLKAKALVDRSECEQDRRLIDLVITDKGLALLEAIDQDSLFSEYGIKLSDEQAKVLSDLLDAARVSE